MKVSNLVEKIFAQAVALEQNGMMKNTIYAVRKEIYILNYDHTVLLRFRLRGSEAPFSDPVSFKADDYDSNEFYEQDGKIVFVSNKGDFQRRKSCQVTDFTPDEIKEIFKKYVTKNQEYEGQTVNIPKDLVGLLNEELSHVEFSANPEKGLTVIQRNIYSGTTIEVTQNKRNFFDKQVELSFSTIGMKTQDLMALFSFQDVLKFTFYEHGDFVRVDSVDKNKRDMTGFIAGCLYDEIIKIKEASYGRKES